MLIIARGRVVSVDRFVEDLWDGEPPPKALASLHAYVSHLRRTLEPRRRPREAATILVSSPPGYRLALPIESVDVWEFAETVHSGLAEADPEAAFAALERGIRFWSEEPFAPYAGAAWADEEIARLDTLRGDAVELKSVLALRFGRTAEVIGELGRHLARYPMRENVVHTMALALYRAGRQADALETIAKAKTVLVEELGVDPGSELRQVESDILRQAAHLDLKFGPDTYHSRPRESAGTVPDPTESALAVNDETFVARKEELGRLLKLAAGARRGVSIVYVAGDPGLGKSTLLQHFCGTVPGNWVVARGVCAEIGGAPPGWPWREILADLAAESGAGSGPTEAEADAFRLRMKLDESIRRLPVDRGLVLVLEDLHLADDETLQVLRNLGRIMSRRILLIGTYRPAEATADLRATIAATMTEAVAQFELGPLSADSSRTLMLRFIDDELDPEIWRTLVDRAGGNPLFLRHLAQLVAAEGPEAALRELPAVIQDVLSRRLSRLPPPMVELLARAAVLGQEIDFSAVLENELSRRTATEDELIDALDAGVVAGLLQAPTHGKLEFSHAMIRDVLYNSIPPMRRQRLHHRAFELLAQNHPERVAAVAYHAAESLEGETAAAKLPYLCSAAEKAIRAGAPVDAGRHLRASITAAEMSEAGPEVLLPLHRQLVQALFDMAEIGPGYRQAKVSQAMARDTGDDRELALSWAWEYTSLWTTRSSAAADVSSAAELRRLIDGCGNEDAELRTKLLIRLAFELEPWPVETIRSAAEAALTSAEALGDPALICQALHASMLGVELDEPYFLENSANRMLAIAEHANLARYKAFAHLALHAVRVGQADGPGAGVHLEAAIATATTGQLVFIMQISDIFAATRALLAGDLNEAELRYGSALRGLTSSGDPNAELNGIYARFTIAHARNNFHGLPELIDAFIGSRADPAAEIGKYLHDVLIRSLIGVGDLDRAAREWNPFVWPKDQTWPWMMCIRGENAVLLGDHAEMRSVYSLLNPWAGQIGQAQNGAVVAGPVDYVLGLIQTSLGDAVAARQHLNAAALMTETGARTWRERVLHALDVVS